MSITEVELSLRRALKNKQDPASIILPSKPTRRVIDWLARTVIMSYFLWTKLIFGSHRRKPIHWKPTRKLCTYVQPIILNHVKPSLSLYIFHCLSFSRIYFKRIKRGTVLYSLSSFTVLTFCQIDSHSSQSSKIYFTWFFPYFSYVLFFRSARYVFNVSLR